jgi:DNA polymerase phi
VDIFVKREPQSPLNVRLVLPLVELATKSTLDERQLSDKASGIIKSRLVKSKDLPMTAPRDEVETVLREVHQRAQRSHASDTLAVLSQASLYLCRILVSLNEEDVIVGVYQESFNDYMSRKASQLALSFFQDWARRFPTLGWKLRDKALESSSSAVNLYRRCQAFQLLHVILSQPDKVCNAFLLGTQSTDAHRPQGEEPAAITTFHMALQKTILGLITLSVDDDRGLSPTQVKDLLKLVLFCIRQTRKTTESLTIQVWDPAAWKTLHGQLSSTNRFKSLSSVLNMCRQVESTAARCGQAVGGKRKAESDEVTETDLSKKSNRKKQKKSKS